MSNPMLPEIQRVRFEEVTPTHTIVAFFAGHLQPLVTRLQLPIYDGYDDLDEIQFAFLTLPSGQTVTLGQYAGSPQVGVDLYIDLKFQEPVSVVFETCKYLEISRQEVVWFHPDWQEEVDRLYSEYGEIEKSPESSQVGELVQRDYYEPIDCFHHALKIYTRQEFPEYWAMLQHNLGLAYADRIQGNRIENLERSIACFNKSLEIFTQEKFPKKWKINQADLKKSQKSSEFLELELYKQSLAKDIIERPTSGRNLKDVDLRSAKLIGANLIRANFSNANLICAELQDADLSDANLSKAKLSGAELSGTNLNNANVSETLFGLNPGISESMKQELIERGAIFIDSSNDRSEVENSVPW
jgi:Pentapeptide repeats (8 copies)